MARLPKEAQVGDGGVVAGPGFRKLPEPKMTLETSKARKEYGIVSRKLYDAGRLTEARHIAASAYAWCHDQIELARLAKRPARAAWMQRMQDQLRVLDLDGLTNDAVAAPADARENKFSRIGLPNRR